MKCPFCAEEILEEAIKCKHCGSEVGQSEINETAKKQDAYLNFGSTMPLITAVISVALVIYSPYFFSAVLTLMGGALLGLKAKNSIAKSNGKEYGGQIASLGLVGSLVALVVLPIYAFNFKAPSYTAAIEACEYLATSRDELNELELDSAYDLGTKDGTRVIGYKWRTQFTTLNRICVLGNDGRVMFPGVLEMGSYIDL